MLLGLRGKNENHRFAIYVHWPIAEYVNIMAAVIW
jgi:hypothetical protein